MNSDVMNGRQEQSGSEPPTGTAANVVSIDEVIKLAQHYSYHLYDDAPVGYVTLCSALRIQHVNLRFSAWLAEERAALLDRPFQDFLSPESQFSFEELFARQGGTEHTDGVGLTLLSSNQLPRYVHAQVVAKRHTDSTKRDLMLVMTDMTPVKNIREETRRIFEKFFTYWRP